MRELPNSWRDKEHRPFRREVTALLESFLASGISQVMAIRVDWAKWRQFFRGAQENPSLQEIFASGVDEQEATGAGSDWRLKIESAPPEERETSSSPRLFERSLDLYCG